MASAALPNRKSTVNREPTLNRRRRALPAVALVAALAAGCTTAAEDDDRLSIVASTNVWGDVAAQVGGDLVDVTSIVSDPAVDPHSYEGSAREQLALSKADLAVVNGGGYDDFATIMLSGLDSPPPVVTAVDSSAAVDHTDHTDHADEAADDHDHGDDDSDHAGHNHGSVNEHVWYNLPTAAAVADQVAAALSRIDPDHADTYADNAAAFTTEIATLVDRTEALAQTVGGQAVAVTEPVPGYLLDALGLVDKTPPQFSEAVENETDVPATVMRDTLVLFTDHQVALLVYNDQTTGPQTEQVRAAAADAQIPVVAVTETRPAGKTYLPWMSDNLDAVADALGAATPSTGTPGASATDTPRLEPESAS